MSVTGTSVQTVTDGGGRFTLQGVPAGRVELRFEGSGVDARLNLDGLQSGQTLTVTVRVTGSSASLVDDDEEEDDDGDEEEEDDEAEFTGTISNLSPLMIAGRTVTTDGSTRYLGHDHETLTPAEVLKVGNRVEVEGVAQPGGSVLAKRIELEEEDED